MQRSYISNLNSNDVVKNTGAYHGIEWLLKKLADKISPELDNRKIARLELPPINLTMKEKIVCALFLHHPIGISKDDFQIMLDINPDSLATYLTSKQMGIAEGIQKKDDFYSIHDDKLSWARKIITDVISKVETNR